MKKIVSLLLTILLVFGILASSVFAANTLTVKAGKVTGTNGQTVEVPISFPDNPGVNNVGFSVGYDSTALDFKGWTPGSVFTEDEIDGNFSGNPIVLSAFTGKNDKTVKGTFLTLKFEIKSGAARKEYPITLSTGTLGGFTNISEVELQPVYENGSVTVTSKPALSIKGVRNGTKLQYTVTGGQGSGSVFAAQYRNGRMTEIHSVKIANLATSGSGSFTFGTAYTDAAYRLFLWDGAFRPLCSSWN